MVQVFVSHAVDADAAQRERLANDLRAAGVDVWMAPGSIRPGESFAAAIDRGLVESDYAVVLLSPSSLASRWVQTEVNAAMDRALRDEIEILPVVVSPVTVPPLLSTFQQIDLTHYEQGLSVLGDALGVPLHAGVAPTEDERTSHGLDITTRRSPDDAFVATVRADLERGARQYGYLVHRAPREPESIVDSIVEVALLRIGVAVWPAGRVTTGRILSEIEQELRVNQHRVAAMLAIHSGDSTTLTPYPLLDAASPNAMLLVWNESDGPDAIASSVDLIVEQLTG